MVRPHPLQPPHDKRTGAIILIMHRLHESLPSGVTRGTIWSAMCWRSPLGARVRAPVGWRIGDAPGEVVRFPAIAEADETHLIDTLRGPKVFTRRRGEALHPEREPLAMLEQIRRTIGE